MLDLRSTTYTGFWRPRGPLAARTLTVRVLQEVAGTRRNVSHLNKATKGRLLRSVLASGATPRTVDALARLLVELGWSVERPNPRIVDIVVSEL